MITQEKSLDKTYRGNASQFFVAGELCRRGFVAVVTMGNCPNTDILCSNRQGTKFAHIQVKTFRPGDKTCSTGYKAERDYGENFFWILGGIPNPQTGGKFEYYIIPSQDMANNISETHTIWSNTPGKKGQPHDKDTTIRAIQMPPRKHLNGWSIEKYLNRWDIIENHLK